MSSSNTINIAAVTNLNSCGYSYDFTGHTISVDTETTGLLPWKGDAPFAVGMCDAEGNKWYCEWPVDTATRSVKADPRDLEFIQQIMADPNVVKVMHNSKFDLRMLELNFGIRPSGRVEDTMYAARICNTAEPTVALKPLAAKYADMTSEDEDELQQVVVFCRRIGRQRGWNLCPAMSDEQNGDYWLPRRVDPDNRLCEVYCLKDTERTMLLWHFYEWAMQPEQLNTRHTYDQEIELRDVVYDMETRGMCISRPLVLTYRMQKLARLEEVKEEMFRIVGREFNLNSPKQLRQILYTDLGFKCIKKTDSGEDSTNWKGLLPYRNHPFVAALFTHRTLTKAVEAFDQYLALMVRERDITAVDNVSTIWLIHANFRQDGTVTGRFSCKEPNLQNVAKNENQKISEQMNVRGPFGPRPGYVWYLFDFSQMELKAFAEVGEEKTILDAIESGLDLHAQLADKAWGGEDNPASFRAMELSLELTEPTPSSPTISEAWAALNWTADKRNSVTDKTVACYEWLRRHDWSIVKAEKALDKKTARSRAKNIMYAKIYGGGPSSVMELIGVTYEEAQRFMRDYDRAFPGITRYIKKVEAEVKSKGYIINKFGRRLAVPQDFAYKGCNYMVQGSCADLVKLGMRKLSRLFKAQQLDAHIVAQIHDELILEIREGQDNFDLLCTIRDILEDSEQAFSVNIPVECARVTRSWDEKETVEL